ncbi:phenylacetate--CoA ligase family protein [Candidatus Finniella inopinata]|uniref:Phenylacetate--CoA ligase family protein n=1 Tax=Candidatus Finniella inopinata TaxID=1696036 RepID=A0A4Q7DIC9_9PROT|nr:phenylacetate--CoA ligase family protein [Candidatus Finniella inopinata]RZI45724.1 phenylacetate--CoA ligase family protein [Candidatus Finniella inopinata]
MKRNKKISFIERLGFLALMLRDIFAFLISLNYFLFSNIMRFASTQYLEKISAASARRAYARALRKVPAYKNFIGNFKSDLIPEMDKENYIKAYTPEKRCKHGNIPGHKVMIDESSGSTGTPFNWIRSLDERRQSHGSISYFVNYCFGKNVDITINAFSLGAWATGLNMGIALERNTIVKNIGPDIEKIFKTLEFFGPKYRYLILGYPPFVKQIIDEAKARNFPLQMYTLNALVGGEGMSEGLRDYLLSYFQEVYSGYGATDIEIGIAGETPISVAIRRLARDNDDVRKSLFGLDSRLPMVFQYNPLAHHIEVNEKSELIFTINRGNVLSPRIRYNIHDQGGIDTYTHMKDKLSDLGFDIKSLEEKSKFHLNLPFMWIYGRSDFTISVMGANIYPEDIEQIIYSDASLSEITRSFCQGIVHKEDHSVRPAFYFEITVPSTKELGLKFQRSITENLCRINADFREAWAEYHETLIPEIHLYQMGEGPFKMRPGQIKQKRVLA